jgi:hypothetical protein
LHSRPLASHEGVGSVPRSFSPASRQSVKYQFPGCYADWLSRGAPNVRFRDIPASANPKKKGDPEEPPFPLLTSCRACFSIHSEDRAAARKWILTFVRMTSAS